METWIVFTLLAVVMQSVRTAGQKRIARDTLSGGDYAGEVSVRLAICGIVFSLCTVSERSGCSALSVHFFPLGNFSRYRADRCDALFLLKRLRCGISLSAQLWQKLKLFLPPLLGTVFFSAALSSLGYLSVVVGVMGLLAASNWQFSWHDLFAQPEH